MNLGRPRRPGPGARPCGGASGRAGRGAVSRRRSRLRAADGARAAPVPDRAAAGRAGRARRRGDASVVYYTALLVNVGCHSDAHEQAKWFGDDIAFKSTQVRPRAAEHRRRRRGHAPDRVGQPAAAPLPDRPGVRARPAAATLDGMIARHAALAGSLAEQLGLPDAVQQARRRVLRAVGRPGVAGELEGDAVPIASRLAQLAEYVEVAHRLGGAGARGAMARERAGTQFDPDARGAAVRRRRGDPGRPRRGADLGRGDRGRARARRPAVGRASSTPRWRRSPTSSTSSRRTRSATPAPSPASPPPPARSWGWPDDDVTTLRRAGLVHGLGRLGVSNSIWDKRGRSARASGSACACSPT